MGSFHPIIRRDNRRVPHIRVEPVLAETPAPDMEPKPRTFRPKQKGVSQPPHQKRVSEKSGRSPGWFARMMIVGSIE